MYKNNFYSDSVLPDFSNINYQEITETINTILVRCYNTVDQIVSQKNSITWDVVYYPLMVIENDLQCFWSIISHLNSVKNSVETRTVYEKNLLLVSEYKHWVFQNYSLYKLYKFLYTRSFDNLNLNQRMAVLKKLKVYELSGINLSLKQKKIYKKISSRLFQLSCKYANNVMDATMNWNKLITDSKELLGIPEHKLETARLLAKNNGKEGWLFTLQYSSYSTILTHCDSRDLREEFYWAYNTRASDQGPNCGKWDNTDIMDEILSLRYKKSQILGFRTYCEKSLEMNMINSSNKVLNFLIDICSYITHQEKKEFLEIQNFAKKYYSVRYLKPWDILYYRERQKKFLFSFTNEELSCFFPEKSVIHGMFIVANHLCNVVIKKRVYVNTWHPDVQFFDIFDSKGIWRGGFYLDIYFRSDKYEGAWMDEFCGLMCNNDIFLQKPIAYLICNFSAPIKDRRPCLLTHIDVITLFHEFGHVLHHIMTRIDIPEISGIRGVPWDVVEFPSQFMEKFFWESRILQFISIHYKTKEKLSKNMINNILKMKVYQSASYLLRQAIYGLFDFYIHQEFDYLKGNKVSQLFYNIFKKYSTYPIMHWERFPHSFIHIFSDNYAANYYSYLWSDMLASNFWIFFKSKGILNRKLGEIFFNDIIFLELSLNPERFLIDFYRKKLNIEAMLSYYSISIR